MAADLIAWPFTVKSIVFNAVADGRSVVLLMTLK